MSSLLYLREMLQSLSRQRYCLCGNRFLKAAPYRCGNITSVDAKIIGIDINPECKKLEEEQITVEIGSQSDEKFWTTFKKKYPCVDILLDDGGHTMNQQIVTFQEMFPHVKNGGIYMCEDCHTSYWEKFGGSE